MSCTHYFQPGDLVVYPNHGVGVIESLRPADNGHGDYYLLHIPASNLHVLVPQANAASVGLRPVSDAADAAKVLQYLGDAAPAPADAAASESASRDWKARFRDNTGKLQSGALDDVAEVVKSLVQLHHSKRLSFREKKMLDRAVLLVANELASAQQCSFAEAREHMEAALAKAALVLPPCDDEIAAAS